MIDKANTNHYYTFWPNPVALTLYRRTASGTGSSSDPISAGISQPTCRETPVSKEDYTAVASLDAESTTWQVWDRGQAYYPRRGDRLVDAAGNSWRVMSVRKLIFGNLYVCPCIKERTAT